MHKNTGLQVIFSIFLGLMLAVFLGIGVYTFYPPPESDVEATDVHAPRIATDPDATARSSDSAARDSVQALPPDPAAKEDAPVYDGAEQARARDAWRQRTSIILIVLATLSMVVSLIRPEQLPVVSSGLLLGGVFTMVYGVGWTVSTGLSTGRFAVVAVAFMVTLALGWLRFSRGQDDEASALGAPGASEKSTDLSHMEARIRSLEARLDQTARALRRDNDTDDYA